VAADRFDLAVVGAGIVGLGAALAASRRGLRVVVVERGATITGASVRNFGQIGTSLHAGVAADHAARSRELWMRIASEAGVWLRETGALMVATAPDELAVLEEAAGGLEPGVAELLTGAQVEALVPVVGAVGGMLRRADLQVDPREAAPAIARRLAADGVEFRWRTAALGTEPGTLHTARGPIAAEAIVVAVNADVDHLYPDLAEQHEVQRCGLDMLLADGIGLGVPVLTGTSMLRYRALAQTRAAAALRARLLDESPELFEHDVNQMYTERPDGTLIVGDTHSRGAAIAPFQPEAAFELLLGRAERLFGRRLRVRERWQGVYASAPEDFLVAAPVEGVRVVSVTTGIGMTTGLGLADRVVTDLIDPRPTGAHA